MAAPLNHISMKFQRIHTWVVKEQKKDCVIKAAMSPMLVADEFCNKNFPKGIRITGLYRLVGCEDFKRYEDGMGLTTDILAIQLNFDTHCVIADLGGRTLPILLVMDRETPVFTEIYKTTTRFISMPDDESLIRAVKEIDKKQNRQLMLATLEKGASDWFNNLSQVDKEICLGSELADKKWESLPHATKIAIWNGTYYNETPME